MFVLRQSSKRGAFAVENDYGEKVVYFFEDYDDAWCFSQHITEELELDKIPVAKPMTVH